MSLSNKRLYAEVVILIAIILLPYWIYLPLLALAILAIPFYWEAVLFVILIEVLYGVGSFHLVFVTIALIAVMIPVHERVRLGLSI